MGSYFHLWAGNKVLFTFKNHMPVEYYAFFQDTDRILVDSETLKQRFPHQAMQHHLFDEEEPVVHLRFDTSQESQDFESTSPDPSANTVIFIGSEQEHAEFLQSAEEDSSELEYYLYASCVKHLKLRMDLMGYTLDFVRSAFQDHLEQHLLNLEEDGQEEELEVAREYTFEMWRDAVHELIRQHENLGLLKTEHLLAVCSHPTFDWYQETLGFPSYDHKPYVFRVMLEWFDPSEQVVLDYTDPALGGWEDPDGPLVQHYTQRSRNETMPFSKVILLTEGTTDIAYLNGTLQVLYPQVAARFSFLDLEIKPDKNGVAGVVSNVRAFASAGIDNTVVAIFDNDAAGREAAQGLRKLRLPDNILVFVPPDVPHGSRYPVLGPDGPGFSDINGRATSIEFYLPTELLLDSAGTPIPVHWKTFMPNIQAYQGELSDKEQVMKAFKALLKDLREEKRRADQVDWSPTLLFWDALFKMLIQTRTRLNQDLLD